MRFSANTLKIGGKLLLPDSHVNKTDFGIIRDKTQYGVYVCWNPGTDKEQKSYVSYMWLNDKYGGDDPNPMPNDPIPDMC